MSKEETAERQSTHHRRASSHRKSHIPTSSSSHFRILQPPFLHRILASSAVLTHRRAHLVGHESELEVLRRARSRCFLCRRLLCTRALLTRDLRAPKSLRLEVGKRGRRQGRGRGETFEKCCSSSRSSSRFRSSSSSCTAHIVNARQWSASALLSSLVVIATHRRGDIVGCCQVRDLLVASENRAKSDVRTASHRA